MNIKHCRCLPSWKEKLECGDRILATIRHPTDGKKNKVNVEVLVISNNRKEAKIKGMLGRLVYSIPYNELKLN